MSFELWVGLKSPLPRKEPLKGAQLRTRQGKVKSPPFYGAKAPTPQNVLLHSFFQQERLNTRHHLCSDTPPPRYLPNRIDEKKCREFCRIVHFDRILRPGIDRDNERDKFLVDGRDDDGISLQVSYQSGGIVAAGFDEDYHERFVLFQSRLMGMIVIPHPMDRGCIPQ